MYANHALTFVAFLMGIHGIILQSRTCSHEEEPENVIGVQTM